MPINLIVATAGKDRVIGKNGDLPWHFPSDLKFFKETTMNHAVLMGRVTYQSILFRLKKPLPGRENIVLTRDTSFKDERVKIIHSLSDLSLMAAEKTIFVIGGADVFVQTLSLANKIYLTQIEEEFDGDVFFPALNPARWQMESERVIEEKGAVLRFQTYSGRKSP